MAENTKVKTDIENVLYGAKDLVTENFELAKGYAQSAFGMANAALTALMDTAKTIDPIIVDEEFDMAMLEALKAKLEEMLAGNQPAFTEEVETAMVTRELERALQIQNDTIDRINAEWSRKRAPLPNGTLVAAIEEIELSFGLKRADTSRDVLIKNMELTQANVHKAIEGYGTLLQGLVAKANLKIAAKGIEMKNLETETGLKIEAMKGMAQIASSLAIGALTAIHVSAGIDARGSASESIDFRHSESKDENYNYNYTL